MEEPEPDASGRLKQNINHQSGSSEGNAKKTTKLFKELKLKVSAQIMDEKVRVTGAKKDDPQQVIQSVKDADFDFPAHFVNYQ